MQATKIDTKTYMYHYKKTPLFNSLRLISELSNFKMQYHNMLCDSEINSE